MSLLKGITIGKAQEQTIHRRNTTSSQIWKILK